MRFIILGILKKDFVHICACILVKFVAATEDDEGYLAVAKNREFIGLLHNTKLSFIKCHLPISFIGYPRYLYFFPTHLEVRQLDSLCMFKGISTSVACSS